MAPAGCPGIDDDGEKDLVDVAALVDKMLLLESDGVLVVFVVVASLGPKELEGGGTGAADDICVVVEVVDDDEVPDGTFGGDIDPIFGNDFATESARGPQAFGNNWLQKLCTSVLYVLPCLRCK